MKIIHILNEFREIGNGIVNVACDLACTQSKSGHNVIVLSNGGEYVKLLEDNGGKHIFLNQERNVSNILPMLLKYRAIIRDFKPDIVHAHMMTGTVLGKLFKSTYNYKLVTTVHNEYQKSSILMKHGDAVVAVSEAVLIAMEKRGTKRSRLTVIKNGTVGSIRRLGVAQLSKPMVNHPAIVTVGFVSQRKGSDILIKAFNKVAQHNDEVNLYFVGNMDWPLAHQLALKSPYSNRIHFEGFDAQPQRYLFSADIFVLPSIQEPFGLVLIEAREAGVPIIASDVDGIPEALSGGRAGCLFKVGNEDDLSNKLTEFLDSEETRGVYAAKTKIGLEEFSVANMAAKYENLYEQLIND